MQKPKVDPDLAYGLNFTPEDLAANRDGYLSDNQRAMLGEKRIQRLSSSGFSVLTIAIVMTLFINAQMREVSPSRIPLIVVAAATGIGVSIYFISNGFSAWSAICSDINKSMVTSVQGKVILDARVGGGKSSSAAYYIMVGEEEFKVEKAAFLRFRHLAYYTLYYTPNTRIILSAEPMEGD